MTQEQKELLLKDLCARLPYGVKIKFDSIKETVFTISELGYLFGSNHDIIPYLRPMESMTEEEKQWSRWYQRDAKSDDFILYMNRYVEWLDSNYFDWRTDGNSKTMIEKGLALEAKEGMYN